MNYSDIHSLSVFKAFTPYQLEVIEPFIEFCSFPADMVIFQQGDQAENFYILTSGEIALHFKPYDGPSLVISKITSDNVFGWSAVLKRETYSTAAVTTSEITAIRMSISNLQALCAIDPVLSTLFLDSLVGVITEKMKNSHQEFLALFNSGMNFGSESKRSTNGNGA